MATKTQRSALRPDARCTAGTRSGAIKSSQVLGLRDRVAIIPALSLLFLLFPSLRRLWRSDWAAKAEEEPQRGAGRPTTVTGPVADS